MSRMRSGEERARHAPGPAERPLAWVGVALLALAVGYGVMRPIANPDLGWHLALGRLIAESAAIPTTEPFTHTAQGAPMVAHEWLSQSLYHGVVQASGVYGLRWLHAGLVASLVVGFFLLLGREGIAPSLALLAVALYVAAAQSRFQIRPHVFSIFFLLSMYGALFVVRPRLGPRQLAAVFASTVVAINMHSGAVILPAIVGLYFAAELVQQKLGWRSPQVGDLAGGDLRRLAALTLLASAAILCTPHRFELFPYLLESGRINQGLSVEWLPLLDSWRDSAGWGLAVVLAIATATVVTAFWSVGRRSLAPTAVALFAVYLPFSSRRFTWMIFIPLLYVFGELARTMREWREREDGDRGRGLARMVAALALASSAALAGLAITATVPFDRFGERFSPDRNFRPAMFPEGAMRFLEGIELDGRLFNSNKWGGYILYRTFRQYPIFIDGRWVTIGEDVVRDSARIAMRRPDAFDMLDAYEIDILLVHRGWMTDDLRETRSWIPVFENYNSGVYLRRRPGSAANLERCSAYYRSRGIPFDSQRGFVEQLAFEANPRWASQFSVRRVHLDQFGAHGRHQAKAARVAGW